MTEIVVTNTQVPDTIGDSLYSCLAFNNYLVNLNLFKANLGPRCLTAVIEGVLESKIECLNLSYTNVGNSVYALYQNVRMQGCMKVLRLDGCRLKRKSEKSRRELEKYYGMHLGKRLFVTVAEAYTVVDS